MSVKLSPEHAKTWLTLSCFSPPVPLVFQNEDDESVVPEATAECYTFQIPEDQSTYQF